MTCWKLRQSERVKDPPDVNVPRDVDRIEILERAETIQSWVDLRLEATVARSAKQAADGLYHRLQCELTDDRRFGVIWTLW